MVWSLVSPLFDRFLTIYLVQEGHETQAEERFMLKQKCSRKALWEPGKSTKASKSYDSYDPKFMKPKHHDAKATTQPKAVDQQLRAKHTTSASSQQKSHLGIV